MSIFIDENNNDNDINNLNFNKNGNFIDIDINSENDLNLNQKNTQLQAIATPIKSVNEFKLRSLKLKKSLSLPINPIEADSKSSILNSKTKFKFNLLLKSKMPNQQQQLDDPDLTPVETLSSNQLMNIVDTIDYDDDIDDLEVDDEDEEINIEKLSDLNDNIFDRSTSTALSTSTSLVLNELSLNETLINKIQPPNVTSTPQLANNPTQNRKSNDYEFNLKRLDSSASIIDGLLGQIYDRCYNNCTFNYNSNNSNIDNSLNSTTSSYIISDNDITQNDLFTMAMSKARLNDSTINDNDYERKKILFNLKQKSMHHSGISF